jgi:nitroreductase
MSNLSTRTAAHAIDKLFTDRWSPRAFADEPIPDQVLLSLFEAARWAPSSYNSQPWRFIYAKRGSPEWARFLDLLSERNQQWAKTASVLVVVISAKEFTPPGAAGPVESRSHAFDAGAAWANLALQATIAGWHAHGIGGFDVERTRQELGIPSGFAINAVIAIGRRGDKGLIPETFHAGETPNGRRPISELAFPGKFPG